MLDFLLTDEEADTESSLPTPPWPFKKAYLNFLYLVPPLADRVPAKRAVRAALNLLKCGVSQGYLRSNYEVKGHRDVQSTLSPGDQLYEIIQRWDHYRE